MEKTRPIEINRLGLRQITQEEYNAVRDHTMGEETQGNFDGFGYVWIEMPLIRRSYAQLLYDFQNSYGACDASTKNGEDWEKLKHNHMTPERISDFSNLCYCNGFINLEFELISGYFDTISFERDDNENGQVVCSSLKMGPQSFKNLFGWGRHFRRMIGIYAPSGLAREVISSCEIS
jgi:hypothetical protein